MIDEFKLLQFQDIYVAPRYPLHLILQLSLPSWYAPPLTPKPYPTSSIMPRSFQERVFFQKYHHHHHYHHPHRLISFMSCHKPAHPLTRIAHVYPIFNFIQPSPLIRTSPLYPIVSQPSLSRCFLLSLLFACASR